MRFYAYSFGRLALPTNKGHTIRIHSLFVEEQPRAAARTKALQQCGLGVNERLVKIGKKRVDLGRT